MCPGTNKALVKKKNATLRRKMENENATPLNVGSFVGANEKKRSLYLTDSTRGGGQRFLRKLNLCRIRRDKSCASAKPALLPIKRRKREPLFCPNH